MINKELDIRGLENIVEHVKDKIVGETYPITLNGRPARVVGRLLKFPHVVSLDGLLNVEFSWETVIRIIREGNGEFNT